MIKKLFGICRTCKDSAKCYEKEDNPPCDAKSNEIRERFNNWTDEYGNTEMARLDLTREEKIELNQWLGKAEYQDSSIYDYYLEMVIDSEYRHGRSEYHFHKTGIKKPTPHPFSRDERDDWWRWYNTQKGVCKGCILSGICTQICDGKWDEVKAERDMEDTIRRNGLCLKCETTCYLEPICIDRKEEIKKTGE